RGLALIALSMASSALAGTEAAPRSVTSLVADYIDRYFDTYPSRATEAGLRGNDGALEDFSPARTAAWVEFNKATRAAVNEAERERASMTNPTPRF
ncbi:MAG: hypothetical protein ABI672_18460, partial [Vicinamibacteria bacterium]